MYIMRLAFLAVALLVGSGARGTEIALSPATAFEAVGIVDVQSKIPDVAVDIRYASANNFVGEPIDGYEAAKCYLHEAAAEALARVERGLREEGLGLLILDCYRPVRAVRHFVRWAEDLSNQRTKAVYYPNIDKREILGEYVAPVSGHSRAATIDLTLMRCDAGRCEALDMGTPFDFFDERAHTDFAGVTAEQRANRDRLRAAMMREGFENYSAEWWHYTFKPEPTPSVQFDIPVR
jgi:D-alanyl-D-alanine dipeptidase